MKLNKIFLLAGIAVAGVLASCSSDDDYEQGEVATGNQLQAVTFGNDNIYSAELDPADPTNYTITLYRDADHAKEAVSVPLKVITNTDGVFEIPATAEFAAGSTETTVTVTFDDTEIGVPYSFEVAIDDEYTNPYVSAKTFAIDIQRVKWNPAYVGTYTYSLFFAGDDEGLVLYRRDDDPTRYKIEHWGGDVDFFFTLNNNGGISFNEFYLGYDHPTYGEVWVYDMNAVSPNSFEKGYYEDGVFYFQIGYHVSAGWYNYGEEIFKITGKAEPEDVKSIGNARF